MARGGTAEWFRLFRARIAVPPSNSIARDSSYIIQPATSSTSARPVYELNNTMTIIPSRLAQLAVSSKTIDEARKRSINAYRQWYRSVCRGSLFDIRQNAIIPALSPRAVNCNGRCETWRVSRSASPPALLLAFASPSSTPSAQLVQRFQLWLMLIS